MGGGGAGGGKKGRAVSGSHGLSVIVLQGF